MASVMYNVVTVKELGFNAEYIAIHNDFGNYEWEDAYGTMWEYDPETGKTRHCGKGLGCFWTDWE